MDSAVKRTQDQFSVHRDGLQAPVTLVAETLYLPLASEDTRQIPDMHTYMKANTPAHKLNTNKN